MRSRTIPVQPDCRGAAALVVDQNIAEGCMELVGGDAKEGYGILYSLSMELIDSCV